MAERRANRSMPLSAHPSSGLETAAGGLNPIERTVIGMAKADPLSSLGDLTGWRDRLARWTFAVPPNRLSNPRLEALRRFAILSRTHWQVSRQELDRFLAAGFTADQAETVSKVARKQKSTWPHGMVALAVLAVTFGLMIAAYFVVDDLVGDPLLALVGIGLISVTLVSLAAPRGSRQ